MDHSDRYKMVTCPNQNLKYIFDEGIFDKKDDLSILIQNMLQGVLILFPTMYQYLVLNLVRYLNLVLTFLLYYLSLTFLSLTPIPHSTPLAYTLTIYPLCFVLAPNLHIS